MSIFNNGTEILKMYLNGQEIDKALINGTEIFAKETGGLPPYTNLINDASFTGGLGDWSVDGLTISATQSLSPPQSLKQTNRSQFGFQAHVGGDGDKYYFMVMGYHVSGLAQTEQWTSNFIDFGNTTGSEGTLTGEWEKIGSIHTVGDGFGLRIWLAHYTFSEACENYYDDAMLVNLTDMYGAGNEPDIAFCLANIPFKL